MIPVKCKLGCALGMAALALSGLPCRAAVFDAAQFLDPPEPQWVWPLITTTSDPSLLVVPTNLLPGVGKLTIDIPDGTVGCSGTLLSGGIYVLTAAHCLTDVSGKLQVRSLTASFANATGAPSSLARNYFVNPGWTGSPLGGSDVAVIELQDTMPITGYELFRDAGVVGGVGGLLAGYGVSGTGDTGGVLPFGTLRVGGNKLDTAWRLPGNPLAYDFDNGTSLRDTIGLLRPSLRDLGAGPIEGMANFGDSGGPTFLGNGMIVGVHSFLVDFRLRVQPDGSLLGGFFGALGGDTRVAAYATWIDSVTSVPLVTAVPEPDGLMLLSVGLLALVAWTCRQVARVAWHHIFKATGTALRGLLPTPSR